MTKIANLNFKYDYKPLIMWQYDNAENLKKIVDNEQKFLDVAVTQFRDEFDEHIFNLDTCDANGLELWGKLLQVSRPMVSGVYFNDEQYRLLLKSRIYAIRWEGTCYGLTSLIHSLFPDVIFRVVDCPLDANQDPQIMTVNIDFASGLTAEQEVVLRMGYTDPLSGTYVYTFLPRPAGVEYNISFTSDWAKTLGFEGMTEIIDVGGTPTLKDGSTTNMGGAYDCQEGDTTGETGTENEDGGVFYK